MKTQSDKVITACICKKCEEFTENDRLVGFFTNIEDLEFSDDDIYFKGEILHWNKKEKEYQFDGERNFTKKEFYDCVKTFTQVF